MTYIYSYLLLTFALSYIRHKIFDRPAEKNDDIVRSISKLQLMTLRLDEYSPTKNSFLIDLLASFDSSITIPFSKKKASKKQWKCM